MVSSKGNVKVSIVICPFYCHVHPLYCEQNLTNSSSEGDCSKLVGDSDSEGFAVTVVSSGLYKLHCIAVSIICSTNIANGHGLINKACFELP